MTEQTLTALEGRTDVLRESQRRLAHLAAENARLRAEGRALRRRLGPPKHWRLVDRTLTDAKLIMHHRNAGLEPSRRVLEAMGLMTQRRYGWAMAFLRLARLEDFTPATLEDLDRAVKRLETTAERLRGDDDLTALRVRAHAGIRLKR